MHPTFSLYVCLMVDSSESPWAPQIRAAELYARGAAAGHAQSIFNLADCQLRSLSTSTCLVFLSFIRHFQCESQLLPVIAVVFPNAAGRVSSHCSSSESVLCLSSAPTACTGRASQSTPTRRSNYSNAVRFIFVAL
jgi:hypothetical protein